MNLFELVILYYLYNWFKFIRFTISCFFYIMISENRRLYKIFKFMHKISKTIDFNIFFNIAFLIISMSNLCVILFNLIIMTIYVTYLHFIKDQYMILLLLVISAKKMKRPIYNNNFLLLINYKFMKLTSYRMFWSSLI